MTTLNAVRSNMTEDQLILKNQLPELARVHDWLEGLAGQYSIPADTVYAMDLCLEEAASNVIRHGYVGAEDGCITIRFLFEPAQSGAQVEAKFEHCAQDQFVLVVEDQAPAFNPLEAPEPAPVLPEALDEIRIGGRGILLMKKFSDSLEYQRLPEGNRLRIVFLAVRPKLAVD